MASVGVFVESPHLVVASFVARFSGDVVAIYIIYPFADIGAAGLYAERTTNAKIWPALIMDDLLTRLTPCSIVKDSAAMEVAATALNECVKKFGNPKRIVLDQGRPGLGGQECVGGGD